VGNTVTIPPAIVLPAATLVGPELAKPLRGTSAASTRQVRATAADSAANQRRRAATGEGGQRERSADEGPESACQADLEVPDGLGDEQGSRLLLCRAVDVRLRDMLDDDAVYGPVDVTAAPAAGPHAHGQCCSRTA
jgi:hypothetical protein